MNDRHGRGAEFGEFRDTVVFAFSGLYVLGYATWAIYSADRGLGVLPPLEGQYFTAGVVPLMFFGAAYTVLRFSNPDQDPRRRERYAKWGRWTTNIFMGLILVAFVMERLGSTLATAVMLPATGGLYVAMMLIIKSGDRGSRWMRWLFFTAVPLTVVAATLIYATRLFPWLAAEFGGPQPVCVRLDLTAAGISPETWLALGGEPVDTSTAARTAPVWQHFNGGGVLVVSRRQGRPVPDVVRLQETAVMASVPSRDCDAEVAGSRIVAQ